MKKTTEKTRTKEDQPQTVRQAIEYINANIRPALPNKDADTLRIMEYVTELNETGILSALEKPLSPKQRSKLQRAIDRLSRDEPLEYITGIADFHGRKFYVTQNTLIPRVETETLVDLAVGYAQEKSHSATLATASKKTKPPTVTIVDVGTGSGCIITSAALCLRGSFRFYATDISPKALPVARKNVGAYHLGRSIKLSLGNLLEPIDLTVSFDIIIANLPYIKNAQMTELAPSVKNYEPHLALDGGANGASLIRELLVQAQDRLNRKGVVLLEVQPEIIETVEEFANRFYPGAKQYIMKDSFEVDRFVVIET